ncbi:MAG: carbohydrate ABC transporter substrate-binding protein [Ruminococcus sp.]|nr:carbohydrate ABC transporter substrate-binding protein [Ruminococcus sp.]
MNKLKRTLALMAALAMTATAFVGCGDKDESSTTPAATTAAEESSEESSAEESSEESSAEESSEESSTDDESSTPAAATELGAVSMPDTGDALTVLCWTDDDLKYMIPIVEAKYPDMAGKIKYQNVGSKGGEANEQYATYFSSGSDVDLYVCDADWVMSYENNDEYSAPLESVGITKDMYSDAYGYTVAIGTDENGVLKGASWQAAAGGYAYRTDLAEQYLGVKTPDEMQAKISDWDAFWSAAAEVYTASEGKTAMADTLGGVWRAYSAGNRTSAWVNDGTITADNAKACLGDFISMAKTNYDAGYINKAEQWTDDWSAIGQSDGDLADGTMGYFLPTWALASGGQLESSEGGASGSTYGKYALTAGPTGWFWGGSWLCVSPNCDNGTFAGQFIKAMTVDADTMSQYVADHSDFVNNKTVMKQVVADGSNSNVLLGGQDQFSILLDSADKISLDGIASKYDATINDALLNAVKMYCNGDLADEDATYNEFLDKVSTDIPDITVE